MIPAPTILYLNDYDTSRLGLIVEDWDGREVSVELSDRTTPLLGRAGKLLLDPTPEYAERTLSIVGTLTADTPTLCLAALDQLRERIHRGQLEVRFADQPGRVFYARRRKFPASQQKPKILTPVMTVTIELACLDAYAYATDPTLLRFVNTDRVACPLGSAPSAPVFELMGSGTDPVITYRRADGTVIGSLTFLGLTMASTDFLRIDTDAQVITLTQNGVAAVNNNLKTAGRFFALDPSDGHPAISDWPTLEVTGVTQATAMYRQAFV